MKKFVYFLTVVPLLCFGQDDSRQDTLSYKYSIGVRQYFPVSGFFAAPIGSGTTSNNLFFQPINISKRISFAGVPLRASVGLYKIQYYSDLDDWYDDYGANFDFISVPITFYYSLNDKAYSKSSLSVFLGFLLNNVSVEAENWGGVTRGDRYFDGLWGIEYQYQISRRFSFSQALQFQTNNIFRHVDREIIFYDEFWSDEDYYEYSRKTGLLIFSLNYHFN